MASYFDEHNCQPLGHGEQPNHLLHLARLLLDSGVGLQLDMEYAELMGEKKAPPAAKSEVEKLPVVHLSKEDLARRAACPVCLLDFDAEDRVRRMPCAHQFHESCIIPWLTQTNSCPVCRHELPTNDQEYEEYKRQKLLAKDRQERIDNLHNSMFS